MDLENPSDKQWKTDNVNIYMDIVKLTVAESGTLSDGTKNEVLQWLSTTNLDGSKCNSSSSRKCVSTGSRKNGIRSGNSSLEPNLETPIKRRKLAEPSTVRQAKRSNELKNQPRIDQCFPKIQGQLQIAEYTLSDSENSPKTPVKNTENMILPGKDSYNDKTPDRKSTPVNSVPRKNTVLPKRKFVPKTPVDLKKLGKSINNAKKENNTNLGTSVSSKSNCSTALSENLRNIDMLETISLVSDDEEDIFENPSSKDCRNSDTNVSYKENVSVSNVNLVKASNIFQGMFDLNSKNKDLQNSNQKNTISKSAIGRLQTEKKCMNKTSTLKGSNDERLSDKENHHATDVRHIQTDKVNTSPRYNNKFINNSKSEEKSPDCSFRRALINPVPLQENISKTLPTVLLNEEKNHQKILQRFCDLELNLNLDDLNWEYWKKNKVSSDSPSNSSESDPEEIVPPVNTKVNMPVNSILVEQRTSPHINMHSVRKSFLASLSNEVPLENADPKAVSYRANYSSMKEELGKELYTLYNEKVFDNKLPKDMSIEWSIRLQSAAGKYKCSKSLEKAPSSSRILLATKILNSPNRLRDVLIHEMCHAATRLISNVRDGHGSVWKTWASKAVEVFPELPMITRCHNYKTDKKFTYRCTCCGHCLGRHRRSLDLNINLCGYCHGPFEILINKVTKAGNKVQEKIMSRTREPKGFAVYVKKNFRVVRQRETSIKRSEVIKILRQKFSAIEVTSKQGN